MKALRIGQVARLAGVGVQTVRYYEREGLIDAPERLASNYRQYKPEAVGQVRFVRRAKGLGFTLREIQELLSIRGTFPQSCSEVRSQVESKISDIEQRIHDLQRMKQALKTLASQCAGDEPLEHCPIIAALDHEEQQEPQSASPGKAM